MSTPHHKPERLMSVGEAADYHRVAPKTVLAWVAAGRLKVAHRTMGGHRRFRESDVHAIISEPGDVQAVPEFMRVANAIAARIERGDLLPGHRLSSERTLATRYDVALPTVRRALKELRDRGLVITRRAVGTYVTNQEAM